MAEQFKNNADTEIDLSLFGKKLKNTFTSFQALTFRLLMFIKRNLIVLVLIFIASFAFGFYIDKTHKSYLTEVIVGPNFGSTDQLYSQINLLQSKINEGDTAFIANLGIISPKDLLKIQIEPINNVYAFTSQNPTNFELIKLLAEDGDINEVIDAKITSKNYATHKITFKTAKITDRVKTVDPLLKFFNSSAYFDIVKKQQNQNLDIKLQANDSLIAQIDAIINEFKRTSSSGAKSTSLVYYNENTQLSEIIKRKDELINEQATLRLARINYTDVIKEIATSLNNLDNKGLNGKNKFILPIVFISIFLIGALIFKYIKKVFNEHSAV